MSGSGPSLLVLSSKRGKEGASLQALTPGEKGFGAEGAKGESLPLDQQSLRLKALHSP